MNQPHVSASSNRRLTPARIALLYATFAGLWIVASGALLTLSVDDPIVQWRIEVAKGLTFVLVTSCLLYLVLGQWRDPLPTPIDQQHLQPVRLRWRVLAFLVLLALVPLAGVVVVKVQGPHIEREAFANLQAIADLKAGQIESRIEERYKDGKDIMSAPGFINQVDVLQQRGGRALRAAVTAHLLATLDAAEYDAALLVDVQGKPLLEVGAFHHLPEQTARQLAALSTARLGSDLFIDVNGKLRLDLVVPLDKSDNGIRQPVGAVVLRIKPERVLFPDIRHWPTASPSGETLIVKRDGDSLLLFNKPLDGQVGGLARRVSKPDELALAATSDERSGTTQSIDYRGIPVFAAYRPVTGTDWVIITKLDSAEVLASLRDLAFWVSLVALLAIASVCAVMLLLLRQRGRTLQLELQAQSDRLLRQFYNLPFIGIAMSSPTTRHWLQFNDCLCEILGYSRAELLNMTWHEMTHPDDLAASIAALNEVLRGESAGCALEKRLIRKDGATVFASLDVKCVRDADGMPEYLFTTVQDITERKRAEARIQRMTGIYAALSECNQAIVRCTSEEELFPQVCRFAVQFGGMKMAWVGLVDPASSLVRPVASYGDGTSFLQAVQVSANAEDPLGRGATGSSIRDNQPFWVQDFLNDPLTVPWHEPGRSAGWAAVAALPLIRNGVVVGALTLHSGEVNAFDEAVRNLLVEMAMDISFALTSFAKEAERKQMEAALRDSESRFRDLYEKAPLAYQSLDIAGNILEVNEAWLTLLGRTREEVAGRFIGDLMTDVSIRTLEREFPQFQINGLVDGPLFHFVHKDGTQRLLMLNGRVARDQEGNFQRTHCIMTDLTERMQSEKQLKLAAKVFEQSAEGIMITDADRNILMVNRAFTTISGYSAAEALGRNPRLLASGRHDLHFFRALWENVHTVGHWYGEMWNRRKDGEIYPELLSISQVLDTEGQVSNYVGIFSDISEHKANEAHIAHLAHFDALTGLPNRSLLADRVGQALSMVERNNEQLALVFLDLDRFKYVNDSLGHRIGDELLIQVAQRLHSALRDEDTVSRLGGDEFIMVLPGTGTDGAAHVAEKLLKILSAPYRIEQHELTITPSLGIAMYPADGKTYEALSMCADAAMYRAKHGGRHTFRFFTREMQERSERTLQLENALRRVLELDQLELYYQPLIALANDRIVGVEALLRWRHPDLGRVEPNDFIPVSEDSGLILPIGEWVLRAAVRQMREWMDVGMAPPTMAVNLSAVQFRQVNLPERVSQILEEFDLPPHRLELELTEGVAMENPLAAIAVMNDLHQRGIRISIDDFGTGYSSLSYLQRFKVSKLKIDQSFVRDISSDPEDATIVEAIIGLSQNLGLQTIAEGVETAEQVAFLREQGCDEVQGYYFAKPMPANEFEAFVLGYRPAWSLIQSTDHMR